MILRPSGMSFLRLAMSRLFKGKACYNDTLALGDWVLVEKPVWFQNKRDILKLPSAVFVAAHDILYFLVFSFFFAKKCAHVS